MKSIIILGSARSDGNTRKVAEYVQEKIGCELIDLNDKNIGNFDYTFANSDDDFLPMMRDLTSNYDTIILATPVYWYSMSATMKTFFDRISDCLYVEKDTGRKLRGMNMAMMCCSSGDNYEDEFSLPFRKSADYLGMKYLGDVHSWIEKKEIPEKVKKNLDAFVTKFQLDPALAK